MPLAELTVEINNEQLLDSDAQRAGLILLVSMLLSFGFIRMSTRMIRAEVSWWPGNVTPGGLHIHHLVFGIVLLLLSGFLSFALQPESPWLEILAALFGIGAGLTLDEFALWLYLEDVYWSEEGRRSVDAVIFAAIIGGALILGFVPVSDEDGLLGLMLSIVALVLTCLVAASKGKVWSTIGGHVHPAHRAGRRGQARAARLALGEAALRAGQPQARRGRAAPEATRPALALVPGQDRRRARQAEPAGLADA